MSNFSKPLTKADWQQKCEQVIWQMLADFGIYPYNSKLISDNRKITIEKKLISSFPFNTSSNRIKQIWQKECYRIMRDLGIVNPPKKPIYGRYPENIKSIRF